MDISVTSTLDEQVTWARKWRTALRAAEIAVCALIAAVCMGLVRLPALLTPVAAHAGRLGAALRRAPHLSALVIMGAALALSSGPFARMMPGGVGGVLARGAIGYLLLGLFRMAALAAQETPTTLARIEERARNGWLERWFHRRIRRPIDAFFVGIGVSACVMGLVPALAIIAVPSFTWMGIAFIWVASVVLSGRHYTMLHVNSHNSIFNLPRSSRRALSIGDRAILAGAGWLHEYAVNPVVDVLPEFVGVMHVYNHHVEQNGLADTTTTLPYDRASFFDFCRLACRRGLLFAFPLALVPYLLQRGRRRELIRLARGLFFFYAVVSALLLVSPVVAVFLPAALFARAVAIGGANAMSEHPFVDLNDPLNPYRNAILVVEDGTDHGWFGEWLHAEHHVRPGLHWATLAAEGHHPLERYQSQGAIGMRAFCRREYLTALWTRRFDRLADYVLWVGRETGLSRAEIARILEDRTRPLSARRGAPDSWSGRLDLALGAAAAWALVVDDSSDATNGAA